jgi:hypothetical protein
MLRTLRRYRALFALVLVVLAVAALLVAARALALPLLPLAIGLLGGIAIALVTDRYRRRARTRARVRHPRVLAGGRVVGRHYDLRRDRSTDDQRWLM